MKPAFFNLINNQKSTIRIETSDGRVLNFKYTYNGQLVYYEGVFERGKVITFHKRVSLGEILDFTYFPTQYTVEQTDNKKQRVATFSVCRIEIVLEEKT